MTKEIVDKYVLVVMEYIHNIQNSEIIRNMDDNMVVIAGLQCIIHVFKLTYQLTGCVQTTIAVTQKGIACYLEYVEQMQKTQFVLNANIADAVTFVYSKTIHDVYNNGATSTDNVHPLLHRLDNITSTILWTNNPDIHHLQRLELAHSYLQKFIYVDAMFTDVPWYKLLELFQEYTWMDYSIYYELLGEFFKQLKKKQKIITKDSLRNNMLYFLAYLKDKSFDEIAVLEGYKSKYDIVAKMLSP